VGSPLLVPTNRRVGLIMIDWRQAKDWFDPWEQLTQIVRQAVVGDSFLRGDLW